MNRLHSPYDEVQEMKKLTLIVCLNPKVDFQYAVPEAVRQNCKRNPTPDDALHLSQSAIVVDRLTNHDIYVAVCAGLNSGNLPYISLDIPLEFAWGGTPSEETKAILEKLAADLGS